jgi:hypothetical protein
MPLLAAPPGGEVASEVVFVPVSSFVFVLLLNFRLYNPLDYPRSVYRFLVVFLFQSVSVRSYFQFYRHHGLRQQASANKHKKETAELWDNILSLDTSQTYL